MRGRAARPGLAGTELYEVLFEKKPPCPARMPAASLRMATSRVEPARPGT